MSEKITLKHPFEFEGEKVEEVSWRRLKGKDVICAEQEMTARGILNPGEAQRTFYMIARGVGMMPEALEEMDLEDYLDFAAKAGSFL